MYEAEQHCLVRLCSIGIGEAKQDDHIQDDERQE